MARSWASFAAPYPPDNRSTPTIETTMRRSTPARSASRCRCRAEAVKKARAVASSGLASLLTSMTRCAPAKASRKPPPHDAPLPLRQVLAGLGIPFVLEHPRRFPREDFSGHVEPGRTAEVVDRPPAARVEARLSQVPLREMLRIRDRFPHGFDGMPERSLEGQRREVTLEGEPARARTDGYRHADLFL